MSGHLRYREVFWFWTLGLQKLSQWRGTEVRGWFCKKRVEEWWRDKNQSLFFPCECLAFHEEGREPSSMRTRPPRPQPFVSGPNRWDRTWICFVLGDAYKCIKAAFMQLIFLNGLQETTMSNSDRKVSWNQIQDLAWEERFRWRFQLWLTWSSSRCCPAFWVSRSCSPPVPPCCSLTWPVTWSKKDNNQKRKAPPTTPTPHTGLKPARTTLRFRTLSGHGRPAAGPSGPPARTWPTTLTGCGCWPLARLCFQNQTRPSVTFCSASRYRRPSTRSPSSASAPTAKEPWGPKETVETGGLQVRLHKRSNVDFISANQKITISVRLYL